MIRLLALGLGLVAVAVVAAWLADHPGLVVIDWRGYRIETSAALASLVVVALMVAAAALARLWRWLRSGAGAESRRRRSYAVLSQGLVAAAGGDAARARKLARRAERRLEGSPLSLLLSAQAAQLAGEDGEARRAFAAMLERPETELLGVRGLLAQARHAGDKDGALKLARRARELKPEAPWVLETLFDLETRAGRWAEAQETLAQAARSKLLDADEARRRKVLVLLGRALEAEKKGDARALEDALEAHRAAPEFAPAAALAARLLGARGKARRASKVIEKTWALAPHPDLARAFAALSPEKSGEARLRRFSKLAELKPEHAESRVALGQLALAAGDWERARAQLRPLADGADARIFTMLAELEERPGGDAAAARAWRLRAAASGPAPAWRCQACGRARPAWEPRCGGCGAFDSLAWAPEEMGAEALAMPESAAAVPEGTLAVPESTVAVPAAPEGAPPPAAEPATEAGPAAAPPTAPPAPADTVRPLPPAKPAAQPVPKPAAKVIAIEAPPPELPPPPEVPLPPDVPAPERRRR